jgi:DNA-binding MurR/RpiR family transcriptional regulator
MPDARKHTLAERIAAADNLAPAERRVAGYFASAAEQVAFLPAAEIAATLGVSNATVVRTAQRLGYAGLPELKDELKSVVLQQWAPPSARVEHSLDALTPDAEGFAAHSMHIRANLVEVAGSELRDEEVRRAVQLLGDATRVVVFSYPITQSIGQYFVEGLRRFGRRALLVGQQAGQTAEELLDLNRDDVVVVLAFSRVTRTVEVMLDRAREQRAPCILVTDTLGLALKGRYVVALTAPSGDLRTFPTATVPLAVLETLMLAVGKLDRARTRAALDKRDQLRTELEYDLEGRSGPPRHPKP